MYLNQFPDIDWIRENSHSGFQAGKDYQGNKLTSAGWPTAVINVATHATERDNIKGPFSMFYNLSGTSLVKLDNDWHQVNEFFYCISNDGESFDLHVPEAHKATTFNIHFGKQLYCEVLQQLSETEEWSLDNYRHYGETAYAMLPATHFMEREFKDQLLTLHHHLKHGLLSADQEYEMTGSILQWLLIHGDSRFKKFEDSSAMKRSTKMELFKRVNKGLEYIHSHNLYQLDLESISRNSGLSKFHFIRVFSEFHHQTPANYIAALKINKAQNLLANSHKDLNTIATELGFSELSAFTRFFKRQTGMTPSSLRHRN
ncbi:MAG: AraC family transcriptional regulator [Cytophagales bacterium]|nr:AraC family transcriptional regulator [Cytophagales bacterium]